MSSSRKWSLLQTDITQRGSAAENVVRMPSLKVKETTVKQEHVLVLLTQ